MFNPWTYHIQADKLPVEEKTPNFKYENYWGYKSCLSANVIDQQLLVCHTILFGLEYKSRGFYRKLRPGELSHGHNSERS